MTSPAFVRAAAEIVATLLMLAVAGGALAQTPPPDPWPRDASLPDAAVLIYQPQVESWNGDQLKFRAAIAIKPTGAKEETFGAIFATARTQVDRVARTVVFSSFTITKHEFPTLPNNGAAYVSAMQTTFGDALKTMSLDRLEASLAVAGVKAPTFPVLNNPPSVIVSYSPAILIPIEGAPVMKTVASDTRFKRVINTHALILQGGFGDRYYLHLYDGWVAADSIEGPWSQPLGKPFGIDNIAASLAKAGTVDLLSGSPNASPKLSLANGVPTVFTSQIPAELIVFTGQPDLVPIVGTSLLWASNTTSDVLVDTDTNDYYVLLSGRWFRSTAMSGPWTFVASNALPAGFAHIPPGSQAAVVLPSVAGTTQAQEAVIANTIPQSASVPLTNGPTFTPTFDGPPQYKTIDGTQLVYVVNASAPLIQVPGGIYYAVSAGVWFTAPAVTGPWSIAKSVPTVIYTIPPSSALHYVTYVQVYGATTTVVYEGYTPGYLGTVVESTGTVVYGTGYVYTPWIGSVWYSPPWTYSVAAVPVYNPYVGFTFGFAMGLATAAWATPYYGGVYYGTGYWGGGGYPCCGTASANVYGHWGNAVYSGTRSWYAGGGVAGTTASGSYYNQRTGTSGNYAAGKQYNAYTGNATRAYDRTGTTPAGGSGNVARASNYNTYTGQRSYASSASATGAGGSSATRTTATTAGPEGYGHTAQTTTYNAKTGQTNTWGSGTPGNDHYADSSGNVYKNDSSGGWQQHTSSGWQGASGSSSWANSEAQARSTGEDHASSFGGGDSDGFAHSSGGGFGGGGFDRGGGGFGGGGFGGGGFSGFHGGAAQGITGTAEMAFIGEPSITRLLMAT
jgi:hypothetical protein